MGDEHEVVERLERIEVKLDRLLEALAGLEAATQALREGGLGGLLAALRGGR